MTTPLQCPSLTLISDRGATPFYVRRIICIGRNYAEHAKEMGHQPDEAPPFFFYKPITALVDASNGCTLNLPAYSQNVHHELELSIAIGQTVTPDSLSDAVAGFGLALDMTCRDTQQQAKSNGRPWDTAKGFDHSAPCSSLKAAGWEELQQLGEFQLTNNGKVVQSGRHQDMIWPIPQLLNELQKYTQLDYGDLILTGTPAGVAAVESGDQLVANLIVEADQSAELELAVTVL